MPLLSFTRVLKRLLGGERWQRLHVRAAGWALVAVAVVLLAGSWIIVPFERSAPHATITSFPLALWWSVETASTVGYGDLYPVTAPGRVIASVVLLAGISVFSVVTAAVATWFVGDAGRDLHELAAVFERAAHGGRAGISHDVRALHDRLDRIEHLLTAPGTGRPPDPPGPRPTDDG
ncbi:potassium channel family protein [Streptomyces sp. NPDC059255]|uniref:potassium channel family protein n=1 Tax=Streptomyces sp. NPDC059255 TaxID=3346793 RepID=UPI003687A1E2